MTIICARDGILAADTGTWGGGHQTIKIARVHKLVKGEWLKQPLAAAASGFSTETMQFREWVSRGMQEKPEEFDKEFLGVLITGDKIYWLDYKLRMQEVIAPYYAAGAGESFALGAMAAGASAIDAVRLTIEHTSDAWGEVEHIDLAEGF